MNSGNAGAGQHVPGDTVSLGHQVGDRVININGKEGVKGKIRQLVIVIGGVGDVTERDLFDVGHAAGAEGALFGGGKDGQQQRGRMPMMAMTTRSSIKVNPRARPAGPGPGRTKSGRTVLWRHGSVARLHQHGFHFLITRLQIELSIVGVREQGDLAGGERLRVFLVSDQQSHQGPSLVVGDEAIFPDYLPNFCPIWASGGHIFMCGRYRGAEWRGDPDREPH